jgi:16S rRNA (uracil1498-N3)-methyltransferase
MVLDPLLSWPELMRSTQLELRLIARPDGLTAGRWPPMPVGQAIILAVGPEGGFSPAEEDLARSHGWWPIRLSTNVLRIETAGLAGAAAILTRCEERTDDAVA